MSVNYLQRVFNLTAAQIAAVPEARDDMSDRLTRFSQDGEWKQAAGS